MKCKIYDDDLAELTHISIDTLEEETYTLNNHMHTFIVNGIQKKHRSYLPASVFLNLYLELKPNCSEISKQLFFNF